MIQKTANQEAWFCSKLFKISAECIGFAIDHNNFALESKNLRGSGFPHLPLHANGSEKASMYVVIGHGIRHFNMGAYGAVCG